MDSDKKGQKRVPTAQTQRRDHVNEIDDHLDGSIGSFGNGCLSSQAGKLLSASSGANAAAARLNEEGIQAYNQGQLNRPKQHFEAAIKASPSLAEAHYNLGMVLYKMGAEGEANPHFMKAADLAPGKEVIWSSPPLSSVQMPSKGSGSLGFPDGHGHKH